MARIRYIQQSVLCETDQGNALYAIPLRRVLPAAVEQSRNEMVAFFRRVV